MAFIPPLVLSPSTKIPIPNTRPRRNSEYKHTESSISSLSPPKGEGFFERERSLSHSLQKSNTQSHSGPQGLPAIVLESVPVQKSTSLQALISPRAKGTSVKLSPQGKDHTQELLLKLRSKKNKVAYLADWILKKGEKGFDIFTSLPASYIEEVYNELVERKGDNKNKNSTHATFVIECLFRYLSTSPKLLPLVKGLTAIEKKPILRGNNLLARLFSLYFTERVSSALDKYFNNVQDILIKEESSIEAMTTLSKQLFNELNYADLSDLNALRKEIGKTDDPEIEKQLLAGLFLRVIIPYLQKRIEKTPNSTINTTALGFIQKLGSVETYYEFSEWKKFNPLIMEAKPLNLALKEKIFHDMAALQSSTITGS